MSEIINSGAATMTSIDLVVIINDLRDPGRAELRHDHFMAKVEKVLGDAAPKFSGTVNRPQPAGGVREYPCYHLPKREVLLMVMSESYAVQARVYDRMVELEGGSAIRVPTTLAGALRLAAEQAEQIESQAAQLAASAPAVAFVGQYVDASGLMGFR